MFVDATPLYEKKCKFHINCFSKFTTLSFVIYVQLRVCVIQIYIKIEVLFVCFGKDLQLFDFNNLDGFDDIWNHFWTLTYIWFSQKSKARIINTNIGHHGPILYCLTDIMKEICYMKSIIKYFFYRIILILSESQCHNILKTNVHFCLQFCGKASMVPRKSRRQVKIDSDKDLRQ